MRIKCPNSDIMLELPGDRTDMRFTCPACHKVHRVTISITTPGETASSSSPASGSMTRLQPQMPKKYATGAYAPVVDVPIDANFVLLGDSSPMQQGVDLNMAAAGGSSEMDWELAGRKTEVFTERHTEPEKRETPSPERNAFEPAGAPGSAGAPPHSGEASAASGETWRDGDDRGQPETAGVRPVPPPLPVAQRPRTGASRRSGSRRRRAYAPLYIVAFLLLALGGYLGWQQYRYGDYAKETETLLSRADAAWERGDASESAAFVHDAATLLERRDSLNTAGKLWGGFGRWSGWFSPPPTAPDAAGRRIRAHMERERAFQSFRDSLDASSVSGMAAVFREAASASASDPALIAAMEKEVIGETLSQVRGKADDVSPEAALSRARADSQALLPALSEAGRRAFDNQMAAFRDSQRRRLGDEVRAEVAALAAAAASGDGQALIRYRALEERLRQADIPEHSGPLYETGGEGERDALRQLSLLSEIVAKATHAARTVLSRAENDDAEVDSLVREAGKIALPHAAMATAAAGLIEDTRAEADNLLNIRLDLYSRRQAEARRGREYPGTKMAWSMLYAAFDDPAIAVDPAGFRYDSGKARMEFAIDGMPAVMEMGEEDFETRIRARVAGYDFSAGWALLYHKPLSWIASVAREMRDAGVDSGLRPAWEILEGPGGPLALSAAPGGVSGLALASMPEESGRLAFWQGRLLAVHELPPPGEGNRVVDDFRRAAERLQEAVMAEESLPQNLRQALKPILMGTHQTPDPRDYFDSAFCRRLIEANYLESFIKPMPEPIRRELAAYRAALDKLEAGYDEFAVVLEDGGRLFAIASPDADFSGPGKASDQDPETGETLPRYSWRIEKGDSTVFYSAMPSRFIYAFQLAEHYDGIQKNRPPGVPTLTEVWHLARGRIASYRHGEERAVGDEDRWNAAIAMDARGRLDPTIGSPGWNFPLHVLQRDDQGDPVLLATLSGTVKSPDFSGIAESAERRMAEDAWLDSTAATFSTPGELGLIFHQFFRYCSDSPLPEMPNLIGSHYGLSDTHQTVYETLERRWVGRLIGDCDDLAEFFQVLTRRQGKLSHVMQLPGHAAAGYVEQAEEGGYRFVILQTGPVVQFTAPTLNDVVEMAYRSFDRGDGISHMTIDAVPLLLRFADEETRTPFVLSARIYEDPEYADAMIEVQGYWHKHVYSAGIKVMERMVEEDPEIGSIKELGSLYERVGSYRRSAELRYRELEMVQDNPQAVISTLLEIVQLHIQDKNKDKALEALGQMEAIMLKMIRQDDAPEFFRAMTFRSFWALYMARLGQPARAWNLVRYDVTMTKRQLGRIAEPVLRTLVFLYERMAMERDASGALAGEAKKAMAEVRKELEEALGRGYFKSDDSYNTILNRYFVMGRYAVSDAGRERGIGELLADGPYPDGPKDQTRRGRGIDDEDWMWFRITPQLYFALGMEMLDQDEYPELYDPAGAKPLLEGVMRAVEKGAGLGSDIAGGDDVVKSELTLAFLNQDLAAFRRSMATVKEKNYSSLYDDAAMSFGLQCGLIPLSKFQAWIDAFREFFPGDQHYFKVVYRAIDKENYDHALMMAEATALFFPDEELLLQERDFVRSIIPELKNEKLLREAGAGLRTPEEPESEARPAA